MTNGEQMFLGHQNGSFLLNTWAPGRRDWVTDRPWRPDGPALVASAGDVRACGTRGLLLPLTELGNSRLLTALGMGAYCRE